MKSIIVVESVTEHEDGSATVVFECNDEARHAMINEGLISLLEKAVSKHHEDYKSMIEKGEV